MTPEERIETGVALLAHSVNLLVPIVGRLAHEHPDPKVRAELLESIEILMGLTPGLVEMFPNPGQEEVLH